MKRKPDAAWKMLFSTREVVRDLVTGFVTDPWIQVLDLDTLEKIPIHFVDRRMRQRITDVVWRARSRQHRSGCCFRTLRVHSSWTMSVQRARYRSVSARRISRSRTGAG